MFFIKNLGGEVLIEESTIKDIKFICSSLSAASSQLRRTGDAGAPRLWCFRRDLQCAKTSCPVCTGKYSGVLVCTNKFGLVWLSSDSRNKFLCMLPFHRVLQANYPRAYKWQFFPLVPMKSTNCEQACDSSKEGSTKLFHFSS